MTQEKRRAALRLWPGVIAAVIGIGSWVLVPVLLPEYGIFGLLGAVGCGLIVFLWWAFFSRVPHLERWGGLALILLAIPVTRLFVHPSIANAGMNKLFYIYSLPVAALALVLWAVLTRRLTSGLQRALLVASILIACGVFALLRTDGITGEGRSQFAWRWTRDSEQQLLAATPSPMVAVPKQPTIEPPTLIPATVPTAPAPPSSVVARTAPEPLPELPPVEWPGFRGPNRDGVVVGVRISTDWNAAPPTEVWRKLVGPGWSSFAVGNGLLYTQEQRGELELVSCYNASTGEPVWTHSDSARFWESNGGAGPRATPTLHAGRVYTIGATGILNALDAKTGAVVWTRNAAQDTGAKLPGWGFAGSPLVLNDAVIVATSGTLAAYDLGTGTPRWVAERAGGTYSSPHLYTIGGVPQIVLLTSTGATGFAPKDGAVLWKHAWQGAPMLQPGITAEGDLLITTGDAAGGAGTRRLHLAKNASGWNANEVWTSRGLKPYFNDSVVHKGHAYGFDGGILSCIDLKDGQRKWKGGRYGHGQALLLRDQDLLLVLSEQGELALVSARPDEYKEVAKVQALEGKTWNHPVIAGHVLFVRNGQEMAAFRLGPGGT